MESHVPHRPLHFYYVLWGCHFRGVGQNWALVTKLPWCRLYCVQKLLIWYTGTQGNFLNFSFPFKDSKKIPITKHFFSIKLLGSLGTHRTGFQLQVFIGKCHGLQRNTSCSQAELKNDEWIENDHLKCFRSGEKGTPQSPGLLRLWSRSVLWMSYGLGLPCLPLLGTSGDMDFDIGKP